MGQSYCMKGGDGTQPPAETPQAPQEQHLPHLLLKMFDSGRSLVQMAALCCSLSLLWKYAVSL